MIKQQFKQAISDLSRLSSFFFRHFVDKLEKLQASTVVAVALSLFVAILSHCPSTAHPIQKENKKLMPSEAVALGLAFFTKDEAESLERLNAIATQAKQDYKSLLEKEPNCDIDEVTFLANSMSRAIGLSDAKGANKLLIAASVLPGYWMIGSQAIAVKTIEQDPELKSLAHIQPWMTQLSSMADKEIAKKHDESVTHLLARLQKNDRIIPSSWCTTVEKMLESNNTTDGFEKQLAETWINGFVEQFTAEMQEKFPKQRHLSAEKRVRKYRKVLGKKPHVLGVMIADAYIQNKYGTGRHRAAEASAISALESLSIDSPSASDTEIIGLARVIDALGRTERQMTNFDQAIIAHRMAVDLLMTRVEKEQEFPIRVLIANAMSNLGVALFNKSRQLRKDHPNQADILEKKALMYTKMAKAQREIEQEVRGIASSYNNMVTKFKSSLSAEQLREYQEYAKATRENLHDKWGMAGTCFGQATGLYHVLQGLVKDLKANEAEFDQTISQLLSILETGTDRYYDIYDLDGLQEIAKKLHDVTVLLQMPASQQILLNAGLVSLTALLGKTSELVDFPHETRSPHTDRKDDVVQYAKQGSEQALRNHIVKAIKDCIRSFPSIKTIRVTLLENIG